MGQPAQFPVDQVRKQFPALARMYNGKQVTYFDGPAGSQIVQGCIDAMVSYMCNSTANTGGHFPTSRETETMISDAREAVADLLGARPEEVAFGANTTTLAFAISRALAREWDSSGEVVVTEMDHRANVDPWLEAARDRGMTVRWLKVDTESLTLDLSDLDSIITDKTRIVAVGRASNVLGTINDVPMIAARAREAGALMAVDVVHAAPHVAIDRDQLGADILMCSAYKYFGPHVGTVAIRSDVFERLRTYKVEPVPAQMPDKLETGTQNHEGIAGVKPAVEFFASLGSGDTRRERILSGYERIETYEKEIADKLRRSLSEMSGVRVYQAPPSVRKTPTITFGIEGRSPHRLCEWMADEHGIFLGSEMEGEEYYATTLARAVGIRHRGGWVRLGLAPYNTMEEADRFLAALADFLSL